MVLEDKFINGGLTTSMGIGSHGPPNASKKISNIALGLSDNLFNFAETKGFFTYRNFSNGFQQDKILSAINDVNNNLHINLTGFSRYRYSKFNSNNPVTYNNIFNWEIRSVLDNPNALQRATFYRSVNGIYNIIPNPFR